MIDTIYKLVASIVNKENSGYMTPTEFNSFATQAQSQIFKSYFEDERLHDLGGNRGFITRGHANLSFNQRQLTNIFSDIADLTLLAGGSGFSTYTIPTNTYFIEDKGVTLDTGVVVTEVEKSEINYLRKSEMPPSVTYPVYERYQTTLRVYPQVTGALTVRFLREPVDPKWTFEPITGDDGSVVEKYDPTNSSFQDFELHKSEFSTLTLKILSLFGINLGKVDLVQAAQLMEDKPNIQDK